MPISLSPEHILLSAAFIEFLLVQDACPFSLLDIQKSLSPNNTDQSLLKSTLFTSPKALLWAKRGQRETVWTGLQAGLENCPSSIPLSSKLGGDTRGGTGLKHSDVFVGRGLVFGKP
uniref:Uncharacterized protein n=1 Tax=Micrurus spixii TaxID=129469 RepID=A0A2D4MSU8_9SAUR